MIFEAVLFDMDGVIIDTHAEVTMFWNRLAERSQITLTESDFVQYIYGRKAAHTLEKLFPSMTAELWQQAMDELAAEEVAQQYVAIPGVIALLRSLKQAGIPAGLVTSAEPPKVKRVLSQLGLEDACYLLGAQRLGKPPERCIVFEDSLSGAEAAIKAGATCVGINTLPDGLLKMGAACVIPDFTHVRLDERRTLHISSDYAVDFKAVR
jgi:HAD superfamily hydrolase (TIGR01509 family)